MWAKLGVKCNSSLCDDLAGWDMRIMRYLQPFLSLTATGTKFWTKTNRRGWRWSWRKRGSVRYLIGTRFTGWTWYRCVTLTDLYVHQWGHVCKWWFEYLFSGCSQCWNKQARIELWERNTGEESGNIQWGQGSFKTHLCGFSTVF